ncbi:unnamed protein product [Caenorhabditis brenneri]
MSELLKYAENGKVKLSNITRYIDRLNFPSVNLRTTLANIPEWKITLVSSTYNGITFLGPCITPTNGPAMNIRYFFCFFRKGGSSVLENKGQKTLLPNEGFTGQRLDIQEILNESNGYLSENGILTIGYGIQVEAILGKDGIWMFNFYDELYDFEAKNDMLTFHYKDSSGKTLHCFQHIFCFHTDRNMKTPLESDLISVSEDKIKYHNLEKCLQIAHGVRLQLTVVEYFEVIDVAWRFNFSNVIRYCEFKIIERTEKFNIIDFRETVHFEMEHCLKRYLEYLDSVEMVADLLKDIEETMGMEQMSSETMKTFVDKFMSF